jgi:tRNA(Ile)-lysidine synthase
MVSRKEIENYLDSCGFSYVTDSTNLSDDYTRNKIRHHVIPILSQLNTSVVKTSAFSLDALRSENDFIEQQADSAYNSCRDGNCLNGLKEYHTVIRRRCIARLLTENSVPYSYDRLESADKITVNGGKINVSGELYLVSDKNSIRLEKISPEEQKYVCTELIIGENRIFDGRILNAELIPEKNAGEKELVHKNSTIYYLDYDKIIGRAFVRSRRCGDRIKLYGNNFTSSVKKLINEKIPPEKRKTLHFIEDDVGTVFAEGMGIADRAAPDGKTQRLLKITVE